MSAGRVRIGLIGCGRIACLAHLPVLSRAEDVTVQAVADTDEGRRAQALRHAPGAASCPDYHSMLDRRDIDAVVICLPPALHAQAAIHAFRAGKHVYVEKPLALSLAEGSDVLDAWKASGRVGMIGFNFRHNELYRSLRDQLNSGRIGQLVAARSVFASAARPVPPWKRTRASGGGALLDLGSHHADITRFLFNEEVVAARATVRSQRCEHDSAVLEMRTETGLIVSTFVSMSAIEEHRFEVYGVRGKLSMHRLGSAVDFTLPTMPYDRIHRIWNTMASLHPRNLLRSPGEPSFAAALLAFADSIKTNTAAGPDLEDGWRSLAIIDAAERSIHSGEFTPVYQPGAAHATRS